MSGILYQGFLFLEENVMEISNVFTLIMVVQNYVGIFRECSDRDGKLRLRLVLLLSSFIDGGQGHSQPHVLL